MNKLFLVFLTIVLVASCGQQKADETFTKKETTIVEQPDSESDSLIVTAALIETNDTLENHNGIIERFFPDEKEIVEFDTVITSRNLEVYIQNKFLDSYVTNEFEVEGREYVDKYRDSEFHLRVILSGQVLADTTFRKEDFVSHTGQDFLEIANLRGYWFDGVDKETIEFSFNINKPETDWSHSFYHFFDLRAKKFSLQEHIDEEI